MQTSQQGMANQVLARETRSSEKRYCTMADQGRSLQGTHFEQLIRIEAQGSAVRKFS